MLLPLTYAVCVLSGLLLAVSGWYAARDRLVDDLVLALAALIELGLIVQAVRGIAGMSHVRDESERATFVAYLLSVPVVPVGTAFLAIKEKSRWAMVIVGVGAFAVLVMTARLQQIWGLDA